MATRRSTIESHILCVIIFLIYTVTVSTTGAVLVGNVYEIIVSLCEK